MVKRRSKRKGKADPVESKRTKDSIDQDAHNPEGRKIFPLDKVPAELVWEILDWVPEAVPHLLRASRNMNKIVEGYAKKTPTIPLVMWVECKRETPKQIQQGCLPGALVCDISVKQDCWPLLALRMRLRRDSFAIPKISKLIKRDTHYGTTWRRYNFKYEGGAEHLKVLELLNQSMGRRLYSFKMETNSKFDLPVPFKAAATLLKGFSIRDLHLNAQLDDSVYELLNTIKIERKVHFSVRTNKVSDKKSLLSKLMSHVREVSIHSSESGNFFGLSHSESAQFIIDAVSNGKVSTLCLLKWDEPHLVTKEGADILRERIPLLDKEIFLKITCSDYILDGLDYELHNFHIKAGNTYLEIKHTSFEED